MDRSKKRILWWAGVLVYVILLYSFLGSAPAMWKSIDGFLGGKGVPAIYLVGALSVMSLLLYMIFVKKDRSFNSYFRFVLFLCSYFAVLKLAVYPAEKMHIIEYTLLSVLIYNALKVDLNPYEISLYLYGGFIAFMVGMGDEFIQGILPNRVFDARDIVLNIVSSALGFLIIRFNVLKEEDAPKNFTMYRH
ncbi:MAG: VanZ family protein [Candidatus Tantalella remota]|nr:VanZ family protein [Candidatus Tantalella remota]